jgi:hypothetical protein
VDIKQQHLKIDRQYQRISTDLPCRAGLAGSKPSAVRILNLSIGGLKFSCRREAFHSLHPADQRTPGRVVDVMIELDFELQLPGQPATIFNTRATVIHSERLSQDEFHIGVQFSGLDAATFEVLKAYIEERISGQR